MTGRRLLLAAVVAAAVVAAAVAGFLLAGRGDEPAGGPAEAEGIERCAEQVDEDPAAARACYRRALAAIVAEAESAHEGAARADELAREEGGFLLSSCHGLMHTVGREYARERGLTLATLMDNLPQSNDPGCSAGFAHGLVTGVAPQIDASAPGEAAGICEETETRYQRYSCVHGFGHAFMRISGERLEQALDMCRTLGAEAPDCAQGAYHDYWFAVAGLDDTERPPDVEDDPRRLCADQPREFVRPCWYRAYVDERPLGEITVGLDIERLCVALSGLQRQGCITAASVVGPADPRAQMSLCAGFRGEDAVSCVRGIKVQNLIGQPLELDVAVVERCETFPGVARRECYRWLGKTLAVVTDGEFAEVGCPALTSPAGRRACAEGAADLDGPLVTFS